MNKKERNERKEEELTEVLRLLELVKRGVEEDISDVQNSIVRGEVGHCDAYSLGRKHALESHDIERVIILVKLLKGNKDESEKKD